METLQSHGILLNAPLYSLSVEQYIFLNEYIRKNTPQPKQKEKEYIYGLRGIEKLFDVSHKTAQRYKDTFLAPAVMQNGRKIMLDKIMALELWVKHWEGKA